MDVTLHNYFNTSNKMQHQMMPSCPPPSYDSAIQSSSQLPDNNQQTNFLSYEEKFQGIIQKYEISTFFAQKLQLLQMFKIVFVFDDSGSMNSILNDSPLNNPNNLFKATRWEELRYYSNISIEIAGLFNRQGCDIYFLNRFPSPVKNICDSSQLANYFTEKPQGYTPLTRVLENVLKDNTHMNLGERKLLVIILTDGEPTDQFGRSDVRGFKQCLKSRPNNVYTNIIACTDDNESVEYLNHWDKTIKNLDICDDYRSERAEVKKAKGQSFPFTFGDYVVKSLIGSIDPEMDNMDEAFGCCTLL